MKVLIDTHVFLWLMKGDARISLSAKNTFLDPNQDLYFSLASFWEIGIKVSIGKLSFAQDWDIIIKQGLRLNRIQLLSITPFHCSQVSKLPFHHRDPFDRMIIAQALTENMSILTRDTLFSSYPIACIW